MRILLLVWGMTFLSIPGFSQSNSSISVREALQIAMHNNPELQYAEEQVRIQRSLLGTSWGIENPEIYYFKEGINENMFSEQRWGISQKFTFPYSGILRNRKAASDLRSAELQADYRRSELRAMVKSAYSELAYSLKNVELVQQELTLAQDLQEIAQARLEVGSRQNWI
jgi:outer membrane protein, heavy metal efflux system